MSFVKEFLPRRGHCILMRSNAAGYEGRRLDLEQIPW